MSSYRYFPLMRSAALRNIAARSTKGNVSQAFLAANAESMALDTSEELAFEYFAIASACDEGILCVRIEEVLT